MATVTEMQTYSLDLAVRDLSREMSTVIARQPKFISLFNQVADATNVLHEWQEDQISPRSVTADTGTTTLTLKLTASDYASIGVNTILRLKGDTVTFRVASVSGGDTATLVVNAANGSATVTVSAADVLDIVARAQGEGSVNGDGNQTLHTVGSGSNYTQIMREEIILSGSAIASNTYDQMENNVTGQTAVKLMQMAYEMNRMAIYGIKTAGSGTIARQAGGIHNYATGLSVTATGTPVLSSSLVNDAAELILEQGGQPGVVLCSIGQARQLSSEYLSKLEVTLGDKESGQFVGNIKNDVTGQMMTIIADYDIADNNAWVLDPSGLGLSYLQGRSPSDSDATSDGYDGIKRKIIAEPTFVFKNANQRIAQIKAIAVP